MQSYDYAHRAGVEEITWERFPELAATLAEQLVTQHVDAIVGIARAGLFPATAVALSLRCEFYPVRITRRHNDQITYDHPKWIVGVPKEVTGKTIAVIDEMADTGETLALVAAETRRQGAARVLTASLVRHSWADPAPDFCALVSDALVLFPWDRKVLIGGIWQPHPELEEALKLQQKKD
jgi:hypoxanthine phosphoribosyltransferase